MNEYLDTFTTYLQREQKQEAVEYALHILNEGKTDIVGLYSNILTPALNNMYCLLEDKNLCIWKEHVRTAIVRTIVECCYPYVLRQRDSRFELPRGKAVVLCPPEEYHDLGARMVADYFTLCGFDTSFVGSNTPYEDFYNAIDVIKPDIAAISVSNYYNLIVTKKIISDLRTKSGGSIKIIVGGYAFSGNNDHISMVNADFCTQSFYSLKKYLDEVFPYETEL